MTSAISAADLEKLSEIPEPSDVQETPTLLSKYNLTVNHLEYDHIAQCENGKELEKIFHVLKSGEEGHYPHLIDTVEKKLKEIKPNSKLLREATSVLQKHDVSNEEWNCISEDLSEWMKDVQKKDKELEERRFQRANAYSHDSNIRVTNTEFKNEEPKVNPKRIAATDYKSWDKYDPDTEILKMDIKDEKLKESALEDKKKFQKEKTQTVKYSKFATEAEAIYEANLEKDRGNECYKAKEYDDAVRHYTNSINIKACAQTYANRAVAYNKLNKYTQAIEDCKIAIKFEPTHLKARFRLAQNYEILGQHKEALENAEIAIQIDPNNRVIQELTNRLLKTVGKSSINTRLKIEDVTDNKNQKKPIKSILKNKKTNENKLFTIIPIPGTSKMSPPFYKKIYTTNPVMVKKETYYVMYKLYPLRFMPTIYESSDDEGESLNNFNIIISTEDLLKKLNSIKINDNSCEKVSAKNIKHKNNNKSVIKVDKKVSVSHQESNFSLKSNFEGGGGEPCNENQELLTLPEQLSPFTFEQAMRQNSSSLLAQMLRLLDVERIDAVIGYTLDDSSLTKIIMCLHQHFMIPSEINKVHSVLLNLIKVPRFELIAMFLNDRCKLCVNQLIQFLDQHDQGLPNCVKSKYYV